LIYEGADSLKAAFTKSSGQCDLLFVIVDTSIIPLTESARTIAEQCKSAEKSGTLTVLVLSQHKSSRLDLTEKWRDYIDRVHKLAPVVPIIDLSVGQQFANRHHLIKGTDESAYEQVIADCFVGGLQELLARVRWVITTNSGLLRKDDFNRQSK
jgi:hypothetical protein